MEDRRETEWKSVPAFGDWEMKNGAMPDYSMDFTKIREMRKQNKNDLSRVSVGNEVELIPRPSNTHHVSGGDVHDDDDDHHHHRDHTPTTRRKILSYFNCCMIGA